MLDYQNHEENVLKSSDGRRLDLYKRRWTQTTRLAKNFLKRPVVSYADIVLLRFRSVCVRLGGRS